LNGSQRIGSTEHPLLLMNLPPSILRPAWAVILWWFAAVTAAAQLAPLTTNPRRKSTLPNIVLILADDLGYGDLGCYGQTEFETPNIDRLAREGMKFTQAYAGSTVCAPSRCALMTGRHTGRGRVRSNRQVPLAPDDVTIAEVLRTKSYRNAVFGKWALGWEGTSGHPNRQGFEEFFGYSEQGHAHDYYPSWLWRNEIQFNNWKNANGARIDYAPDWFQRAATNFLEIHEDRPFFLYFPTIIPHAHNELGTNGMEVPSLGRFATNDWPRPEKAKAAMIERLDATVGAMLDRIARSRIDAQTLIIFTSDNGPHAEGGVDPGFFRSSGPLRGIKRSLHEGGIRVPFIVRWPGHVRAGSTNDLPIAFWDVLPTIAEIVQTSRPRDLDGISFANSLLGREQKRKHDHFYWESHEKGYSQAVRFGDWKAVKEDEKSPIELYDLATDLGETNNVAAANADLVKRAQELMTASAEPWITPTNVPPALPWAKKK
jgi:arylsulfatase A-like enzyme